MNNLILGAPNIGKSSSIEKYIEENYKSPLYLGTLWFDYNSIAIINRHRLRRSQKWNLFECSNNLEKDIQQILSVIANHDSILVDGYSNWIKNYLYNNYQIHHVIKTLNDQIVNYLLQSKIDFFLIDSYPTKNKKLFLELTYCQSLLLKLFKHEI